MIVNVVAKRQESRALKDVLAAKHMAMYIGRWRARSGLASGNHRALGIGRLRINRGMAAAPVDSRQGMCSRFPV